MTETENKIYSLVHTWCDEQAQDIPDQNRRYLMDAIIEVAKPDLKEIIERWERWQVEKGNYPEYRTHNQLINDFLSEESNEG